MTELISCKRQHSLQSIPIWLKKKKHLLYGSLQKPFASSSFGLLHSKNSPPPFSPVGRVCFFTSLMLGVAFSLTLDDEMLGDMPWACIVGLACSLSSHFNEKSPSWLPCWPKESESHREQVQTQLTWQSPLKINQAHPIPRLRGKYNYFLFLSH